MFLKITVKILIRLKYYVDTCARCLLTQAIHALFRNDSFSILLEQQPYTLDSIFLHYTIHISKSIALNAGSDFYLQFTFTSVRAFSSNTLFQKASY